jgi:hypothetical protein
MLFTHSKNSPDLYYCSVRSVEAEAIYFPTCGMTRFAFSGIRIPYLAVCAQFALNLLDNLRQISKIKYTILVIFRRKDMCNYYKVYKYKRK